MAMWEATREHETSFTEELGRDLLVLAAGMGVAAALGAVAVWVVEPVGLLTGWNRDAALWSLLPALVLLVGTASFATFINAGGLGALIQAGINLFRYPILVSGAILIALLALVFEWAGRVLEAIVTPKGL